MVAIQGKKCQNSRMRRCRKLAFLFLLLPFLLFYGCSSRWNTPEATLDDAITIELSDRWQVQQGNESRIDACFKEGEVIAAIYPVEGTLDEAIDNLLDAGAYFLTGKSSHGDFSGEYFCLVGDCLLSSSQLNVQEANSLNNSAPASYCAVYLFLFQSEDRAYCAELLAHSGGLTEEEAQAEFDKLIEPGYIVLDTMKKKQ